VPRPSRSARTMSSSVTAVRIGSDEELVASIAQRHRRRF
jgi:hypothetical protein